MFGFETGMLLRSFFFFFLHSPGVYGFVTTDTWPDGIGRKMGPQTKTKDPSTPDCLWKGHI
jgi:hypothetical protein